MRLMLPASALPLLRSSLARPALSRSIYVELGRTRARPASQQPAAREASKVEPGIRQQMPRASPSSNLREVTSCDCDSHACHGTLSLARAPSLLPFSFSISRALAHSLLLTHTPSHARTGRQLCPAARKAHSQDPRSQVITSECTAAALYTSRG